MKPAMRTALWFSCAALLAAAGAACLFVSAAARRVAEGNAAYGRGNAAAALALYDNARLVSPGSPVPLLDFAVALYATGDYAAALTAFQAVRPATADMAAEVHYDQGNALARLGRQAEKEKPEEARDLYLRSVAAYQRALAVDGGRAKAAVNVEVVRQWLADLPEPPQQGTDGNGQQPQQQPGRQSAPGQNAPDAGGTPGTGPSQPQQPGAPTLQAAGPVEPLNDTAQSIVQEERDRRQAEAAARGERKTNESPNW